jgi:hypothetical protein
MGFSCRAGGPSTTLRKAEEHVADLPPQSLLQRHGDADAVSDLAWIGGWADSEVRGLGDQSARTHPAPPPGQERGMGPSSRNATLAW